MSTSALLLADKIDPLLCNEMSFHDFADAAEEIRNLVNENAIFLLAINRTIDENKHLADGENCTLRHLTGLNIKKTV